MISVKFVPTKENYYNVIARLEAKKFQTNNPGMRLYYQNLVQENLSKISKL